MYVLVIVIMRYTLGITQDLFLCRLFCGSFYESMFAYFDCIIIYRKLLYLSYWKNFLLTTLKKQGLTLFKLIIKLILIARLILNVSN